MVIFTPNMLCTIFPAMYLAVADHLAVTVLQVIDQVIDLKRLRFRNIGEGSCAAHEKQQARKKNGRFDGYHAGQSTGLQEGH